METIWHRHAHNMATLSTLREEGTHRGPEQTFDRRACSIQTKRDIGTEKALEACRIFDHGGLEALIDRA
jgi:hypothetical protein